tara:strand:+ start:1261 stop:2613 length:1353 start_codon:yes stop_codon:yes gene_type:complete
LNIEKFLFSKVSMWVLLIVIIFFLIFSFLFGGLVLRSETAQKIVLIPKDIKTFFSDELDLGFESDKFENRRGFKIYKKNSSISNDKNFLLLSRYSGEQQKSIVELIDLKDGKKIHEWSPDFEKINAKSKLSKEVINFKRDHNNKRYQMIHPYLMNNGDLFYHSIYYSPLVKVDICSRLISTLDMYTHHSIESESDGLWTPITYLPSKNNPGLDENKGIGKSFFYDDGILKVNFDNEKIFEKSFIEILVENKLSHLIFGGKDPSRDPLHLNDIQPVLKNGKFFKKGDLFLSFRNLSMIILYRPSTNKVIWYKQFPWELQHDVDILDDSRISIFNNNRLRNKFDKNKKFNDLIVYDFETNKINYILKKQFNDFEIQTIGEGLAEIYNDNSVFIEESNFGRLLMLDQNGEIIWEYINRSKTNNKLYRLNWSRVINLNLQIFKKELDKQNDCKK